MNTPKPDFTLTSGTLPPGLSLSPEGVLIGTPTSEGLFTFSIRASNGFPPDVEQEYKIGIGNYRLLETTADHGSVNGAGLYLYQAKATLTATPAPGFVFTKWTGGASGSANPLTVTMDADKQVTAVFGPDPADPDADGLSNHEEYVLFGTDPANPDSDGDGLKDGQEITGSTFAIVPGLFTAEVAREHARASGGYLATFASEHEWNRALTALGQSALDPYTGLWIGATDATTEGTWQWLTAEPFAYARWAEGQPDNGNNSDHAEISGGFGVAPGHWLDTPGAAVRDGYLLEKGYVTHPTVADIDADGLNDGAEAQHGSNPYLADTDADGLNDWIEVYQSHTNPLRKDSDGDDLPDGNEDSDGDGLANLTEIQSHKTHPGLADTDGDGLSDAVEVLQSQTDPLKADSDSDGKPDGDEDTDGDGLSNLTEATIHRTDPGRADTDGDSLSDPQEIQLTRTNPLAADSNGNGIPDGLDDADADGLNNLTEVSVHFTDPLRTDTDNDGLSDAVEVLQTGTHPLKADSDSDGTTDTDEDSDSDGLTNRAEVVTHGTQPGQADSDGDSLSDGEEILRTATSPLQTDSDSDGTPDPQEDLDGDGLTNLEELRTHNTHPALADTDGDGLSDLDELARNRFQLIRGAFNWAAAQADATAKGGYLASFTSEQEFNEAMANIGPQALNTLTGVWIGASDATTEGTWLWTSGEALTYSRWAAGQPDNAGGADTAELQGGYGSYPGRWIDTPAAATREGYLFEIGFATNPTTPDTDGDGLTDRWEIELTRSNPLVADTDRDGTPDPDEDPDGDTLANLTEIALHQTHPNLADTDGDAYRDDLELRQGSDPRDPLSVPTFALTLAVGGDAGGSVLNGPATVPQGTFATLTASPAPGYQFTGWSGDATGSTNPLEILFDSHKQIIGHFARDLSDPDNDGLTTFDEVTIHHTNPLVADTDGDGISDGDEVNGIRFTAISGRFTWEQARTDALQRGGDLASLPTADLWNRMLQALGNNAFAEIDGLWIGATDRNQEGSWRWVNGEALTFHQWAATEPDNLNDSDYACIAGEYGGTPGKWYDYRASVIRDGYILETKTTSNPLDGDTDGDGLSNTLETDLTHTNPNHADTDGDSIPDGDEDPDGDGLGHRREIAQYRTHPMQRDTNTDGIHDGLAVALGLDPLSNHADLSGLVAETRSHLNLRTPADLIAQVPVAVAAPFDPAGPSPRLRLRVQSSTDLESWQDVGEAILNAPAIPSPTPNPFLRLSIDRSIR